MNALVPLISLRTPVEKQMDYSNTAIADLLSAYRLTNEGLFYVYYKDGQEKIMPLSSAFQIVASTCNSEGGDCGRLIEFNNKQGQVRRIVISMEALAADGHEVRKMLLQTGLIISGNKVARERLLNYFLYFDPEQHMQCANRTGWNGTSYILPDRSFDKAGNDQAVYQSAYGMESPYAQSGTLEEWINHVARPAQGNSRLVLGISTGLAGALAKLANLEGGGVHFCGNSSSGKTTILRAASSSWGKPSQFMRQWLATGNGLEGIAALHNDCLLPLDEAGQCEPRVFANSIYTLANGQGKTRANSLGTARPAQQWRIMILSSGEITTEAHINQSGQRIKAGQVNRLANVEADAGSGMGVFENIHGAKSPNEFAQNLSKASETYYGTIGLAWVEYLAHNQTTCTQLVSEYMQQFIQRYVPKEAQGQVMRVANRFALIAAAGEMATTQELTGWEQGEAMTGVAKCFNNWLMNFGDFGNYEEYAILSQVRQFIESHGSSRFEVVSPVRERISNRIGLIKTDSMGDKYYCVYPEQFKREICKGFDFKLVEKVLQKHGWLKADERGGVQRKEYDPETRGSTRMYVLIHDKVCACESDESARIMSLEKQKRLEALKASFGEL